MAQINNKVLLFNSEACGYGDADLGFEILVSFFRSLVNSDSIPGTIVFWNTAVNLLTDKSPVLIQLKALEEKGVRIFAGKLCVSDLCLSEKLAVGKIVSMQEIIGLLMHNEVISF